MTSSTGSFGVARRRGAPLRRGIAVLVHALAWPVRVYEARKLMLQLGGLDDHELRDIGLTRLDLRDANSLAFDADPSLVLRRRAEGRRRRS